MKKHFLKSSSILLAAALIATILASCGKNTVDESSQASSNTVETSTTVNSLQTTTELKTTAANTTNIDAEQASPTTQGSTGITTAKTTKTTTKNDQFVLGNTRRYGISNGQWGQFSEYAYNERGQLVSVTAIFPTTLAPLCHETIKNDRVYIYNKDGTLNRVWLNGGIVIAVTHSADGLTATGSCTKDGETYRAKLTFSSKRVLLKEEYTWSRDSLVNEYDASGNIIKITQGTGFVTTHTYSKGKIAITLYRKSGEKVTESSLTMDGTKLTEITIDGETLKLTYQNGLCTGGTLYGQTSTVRYDDKKRVISTKTTGGIETIETFVYNADSKISQYTRERKSDSDTSWAREVITCVYTYAQDGTISKFSYLLVEYDKEGNEIWRRENGFTQ